jgi:hypothetical protein
MTKRKLKEPTKEMLVCCNADLHRLLDALVWAVVTCRCTGDSSKCSKRIDEIVEEYKATYQQDEPTY